MPPGCGGSNGSYTCGSLNIAGVDTVTISGTRPDAVTVTQNLSPNDAKINQGSSAADPALVVQGRLTPATKKGKLRVATVRLFCPCLCLGLCNDCRSAPGGGQ
jgi:hypothetical protein